MSVEIAVALIGLLGTVGMGWLTIWSFRQDAARKQQQDDMRGMGARISAMETRATTLESDVRHLPNVTDVGKLHEKLNEMVGTMNRISGSQETLLAVFSSGPGRRATDQRKR